MPTVSSTAMSRAPTLQNANVNVGRPEGNKETASDSGIRQIDWRKTRQAVEANTHLTGMAAGNLRLDRRSLQSTTVLILQTDVWTRSCLYCLLIVACQFATALCLSLLFLIELSRLFATIYAYLKYKYLKNIICLLMEVSQSFFLALFMASMMSMHLELVDNRQAAQDTARWSIVVACILEYILQASNIIALTYTYLRHRRQTKDQSTPKPSINKHPIFYFDVDPDGDHSHLQSLDSRKHRLSGI